MKFNFSQVKSDPAFVQESFNELCLACVEGFVETYKSFLPPDTMDRFRKEVSCDRDGGVGGGFR